MKKILAIIPPVWVVILAISILALPVMAQMSWVEVAQEPDQSPDLILPDFSTPDFSQPAMIRGDFANNCDDAKVELSDWLIAHGYDSDSAPQASSDIFDSYGLAC